MGEALVRGDDGGGREPLGGHARAQDVEPVEGGLGGDRGLLARVAEGALADRELEVLGHLRPIEDPPDPQADRRRAPEAAPLDLVDDALELPLGRAEQRVALSRPLGGEDRVPADDEPLAREVGARAPRPGPPPAHPPPRGAVTQPIPPRSLRRSIRALVSIPRSPARTMSDSPNVRWSLSSAVSSVAGSAGLPGNASTASGRAARAPHEPEHALLAVGRGVAGVAVGGELAGPPGDVRRADVVEDERARPEMAGGQGGLDRGLASEEPVERRVQLVGGPPGAPPPPRRGGRGAGGGARRGAPAAGGRRGGGPRAAPGGPGGGARVGEASGGRELRGGIADPG